MKGKIGLVPFPFTDFTATKLRPALVIYEGNRDIIVHLFPLKYHLNYLRWMFC